MPKTLPQITQVYPVDKVREVVANAPVGSFRQASFQVTPAALSAAVQKSLGQENYRIAEEYETLGVILASRTRLLDPPPDLLNCPNNHFANSRKQEWQDYLAITVTAENSLVTVLRVAVKTQGRCLSSGGCYGHDPCPEYAAVHWARGYDSAEMSLARLFKNIEEDIRGL